VDIVVPMPIVLLESLRPRASHDAGLWRIHDGEERYDAALRVGTAAEPDVQEIRRKGAAELHELNAQTDTLLKRIGLRRGSVRERLQTLSSDERHLYPDSDSGKDRAVADMNVRLETIRPLLKPLFRTTLAGNVKVRRLTLDDELAGRPGYRVAPSLDGTRPGNYFVDLHSIRDRPTWSLPTVTYHETLPGHLLQLPLQEAARLHPVRQQHAPRACQEGWAIYAV
jgi:uncharacterized protein (DUF885 family)